MVIIGKIIGGICGYAFGGVIGLLIGVIIGHLFDRAVMSAGLKFHFQNLNVSRQHFFNACFSVMGHIAKADGRVSENEIQMARNIMQRLNLDATGQQSAIDQFTLGKQADFNLNACLQDLKKHCRYTYLLRMFLDLQVQAAFADGRPTATKQALLQGVARALNLPPIDFAHVEAMLYGQYQQYSQQSSGPRPAPASGLSLAEAYRILGVSSEQADEEIKRAYRKLISQNHPDKLISKGLPEGMLKMATEKTQQIQKAYDLIKSARGMV